MGEPRADADEDAGERRSIGTGMLDIARRMGALEQQRREDRAVLDEHGRRLEEGDLTFDKQRESESLRWTRLREVEEMLAAHPLDVLQRTVDEAALDATEAREAVVKVSRDAADTAKAAALAADRALVAQTAAEKAAREAEVARTEMKGTWDAFPCSKGCKYEADKAAAGAAKQGKRRDVTFWIGVATFVLLAVSTVLPRPFTCNPAPTTAPASTPAPAPVPSTGGTTP